MVLGQILMYRDIGEISKRISRNAENVNANDGSTKIQQFCDQYSYKNGSICGIGLLQHRNDSVRCIPWKYSLWNEDKILENTTICKRHKKYTDWYWCATGHDLWEYCPPIKCKYIHQDENICQDQIYWSSTTTSIRIDFSRANSSQKHGILVVLSLIDYRRKENRCFIAKICVKKCPIIDRVISRYYQNACKPTTSSINNHSHGSTVVTFADLAPQKNHTIYLMSVINDETVGSEMIKLLLKTRTTKAPEVKDVSINNDDGNLCISWSINVDNSTEASSFLLMLVNLKHECLYLIKYKCNTCEQSRPLDEMSQPDVRSDASVNISNCGNFEEASLSIYNTKFMSCINRTVHIGIFYVYANNSMGLTEIMRNEFHLDTVSSSFSPSNIITIIIVIIIFIFSGGGLIYQYQKRRRFITRSATAENKKSTNYKI